ncbi:helix-turn-helix transcriptional regulator [Fulvivirga sp. M361]|uniref:response regulator transcription factor n=1 Tax=Fulvivirga sp. M361 TaxID=2594266 RepID=UPI001179B108|nr:helix-turn-helix transcriptional regulator [Fulvivirga sp. M361]TRX54351.1 helix-turn-helix transcriptional regulator [Fulvivirga sp. M361]
MGKGLTEFEQLSSIEKGVFVVENHLSSGMMDIEDIKRLIPCFIHLNNVETLALEYIDPDVSEFFRITEEKVQRDGMAALQEVCHPGDLEKNTAAIHSFFSTAGASSTMSFFERLRTRKRNKNEFNLHFSVTKLFNERQCIVLTFPVHDVHNITGKISSILDEHAFLKKNFERFASLTKQEKKVLKLLAMGYNNPKISEELFISRRTVENHRKRINKKLETKNLASLIEFARAFNLYTS